MKTVHWWIPVCRFESCLFRHKEGEIMRTNENGFLLCPRCRRKTAVKVRSDTELKRFPLYCKQCKQETVIDYRSAGATEPEPEHQP